MSIANKRKIGLLAGLFALLLTLCAVLLFQPAAEDEDLSGKYYSVVVNTNDPARGNVRVTGNKNEQGQFIYGTNVTLTAIPEEGYRFVRWEGDSVSSSNPFEFPVQKTDGFIYSYTAIFEPNQYDIIIDNDLRLQFAPDTVVPDKHIYGTPTQLPTPLNTVGYTFVGWRANSAGITDKDYRPGDSLGASEYSDTIYLTPRYEANPFDVTCIDRVENANGKELGRETIHSHFDVQNVTGADAPDAIYRGYYFLKTLCEYTTLDRVTANPQENVVYRYYKAKTYRIIYENCEEMEGTATQHTYGGADSVILNPLKEGYTFVGWKIKNWSAEKYPNLPEQFVYSPTNQILRIGGEDYDNPDWTPDSWNSEEYAIILEAQWRANDYHVSYEGLEGVTPMPTLPSSRRYDQDFTLPDDLSRPGYTFLGWKLKGASDDFKQNFVLPASSNANDDLVFVAGWAPNDYNVTLDPDADVMTPGDTGTTATSGQPLPSVNIPQRKGYTFRGYYTEKDGRGKQYYDENGNCVDGVVWDIADDTVLYAYWSVNQFKVEIDSDFLNYADVIINGTPYDGTPMFFDFHTQVSVTVTMKGNYKLVKWNGVAIPHQKTYSPESFVLEEDTVLNGTAGEILTAPAFYVNYREEIFQVIGGIPAGSYLLRCNGTEVAFTVSADGMITFASGASSRLRADAYFGSEVQFILCGNGETTADSDPVTVAVAARPARPELNDEIHHIAGLDNSIEIVMNGNLPFTFEFACSAVRKDDGTGLNWVSSMLFENLNAGTPYYVYIRVAASDTYPHGEIYSMEVTTLSANYLAKQIDRLMNLRQPGDGSNVDQLLENAKQRMENCQTGPNYVADLEAIYQSAENGMELARAKDRAIAELRALCLSLKNSNLYSDAGIDELQNILESAETAINNAQALSEVQRLVENAENDFYAVLIAYLLYGDDILLTSGGMDRNYKLIASRIMDITTVSAQIQRAIQAGTIVVGRGTPITLAEATRALQSLDVVGFYHLRLSHTDANAPKPNGPFIVRLLLPEDLRSVTGLRVAYYKNDTGELTILDTERSGNYLVFTADSVADFVILGDRAVNLGGLLIALTATLFCQLIAILILLVRRRKFAKERRNACFALPLLALTVRFFPDNSMTLALVLGALVVVFQIILLWLLISTEVIYRRKKEPEHEPPKEPQTTPAEDSSMSVSAETPDPYFTVLANSVTDEEYEELEGDYTNAGDAEEPDLSDAAVYEPDTEEDAEPEHTDWYDDRDFIEPAANPRYSLQDDTSDWGEPYTEEPAIISEDPYGETDYHDEEAPYEPDEADGQELYEDQTYGDDSYVDELYEESAGEEEYDAPEDAQDTDDPEGGSEYYDPMAVFEADTENSDNSQY